MADLKISGLTDGAPAVATDSVPVARGATTRRLTLANLITLADATYFQRVYSTSDVTKNANTTLIDIPGLKLAISASATEVWGFECQLFTVAASSAPNWKFGMTVPTGCTTRWGSHGSAVTEDWWGINTGQIQLELLTESGELSIGSGVVTGGVYWRGWIFGGGTAGDVQMKFAQSTSSATDSTVKALSLIRAEKYRV